ncbi:hypothetical protein HYH03_003184 [Edaphochlamys debaryana]|uniref:EF-hand domain-containing protein n=1 Tax=Edaphochlamys debaryana TaxID=47281 RepID=A0A835YCZ7_9CHLO|nr:hypothetical protein HYH03_003184 [Edaphochlamys debaryana]|eukprot:KAG2498998.1 hypothetical protein HYH03_003184 [Edaphochlamys debaryana]
MSSPGGGGGPTALASSYVKICSDIGCAPLSDVLGALTGGQRYCSVTSPTETLPDGSVIALCAVLPASSFELLSFHNLNLSANSWAALADACSKTRQLQRLVFKDCSFKDGQLLSMFSRALAAADLTSLELINCPLGDDFISGLAEGALLGSERFTNLRLAGCGLSDPGALRLAKAIEGVGMMCSLRLLDLSHNRIGDAGACGLAAMLGSDASPSSVPLNTLELEGNLISDVGGLALCKAAKAALMLQRLNLSLNPGLTSATMLGVAEAVRFNTGTLREVALAGCRASEDAAVALLKAANKNTTLQLLDIRGVPLAAEGVAQLCALLRYTTSLNTLRVDVASPEGAEAITRDLPANRSLMHITLGGPVPDGLLAAMSEILAANTVRRINGTPAANSPHIHAWIEDSTQAYQHGMGAARASQMSYGQHQPAVQPPPSTASSYNPYGYPHVQPQTQPGFPNVPPVQPGQPVYGQPPVAPSQAQAPPQAQYPPPPQRSRSPSPPPEYTRSPRSEAGNSVHSHATHRTGRTHRSRRSQTSYLSFGGFTDMSRRTIMVGSTPLRVSASLAAGGAAEKAAIIFRNHDMDDDNSLNKQEMLAALEEMGVLNGIKAKHIGRFLDSEFKKADWDKDGRISLQDFISYYEKIAYYQAQMAREGRIKSMANLNKSMVPSGVEHNAHLKRVFKNYSRLAIGQGRVYADGMPQMNSAQFHRLCQDAGFMEPEGRLSTTAVDVIFTRYRAANSRRMALKDFIAALAACAYEMGYQFDDIMEVLGANAAANELLKPNESARDNLSESSAGVHYVHSQQAPGAGAGGQHLPGDPSFDVLGVPLATVHEGAEGKKGKKTGKSKAGSTRSGATATTARSGAAGGGANALRSSVNTNPLYDSTDPAGGPVHSSFNLHGALGGQRTRGAGGLSPGAMSPKPGRNSSSQVPQAAAPGVQPSDLAVLEARVRLEMEATVRQLEERLERQVAAVAAAGAAGGSGSGPASGGLPASADALLGAKLRQLEGQVSGVVTRQDELDRVASQLGSLQDILNKLAEEMVRIKSRADSAATTASSAVAAAQAAAAAAGSNTSGGASSAAVNALEERVNGVTSQLSGLSEGIVAVGRDVASLNSQLAVLESQTNTSRTTATATSAAVATLQQQVRELAAQVASIPAAGAPASAQVAALEGQVAALEKKLLDRLSRYDGALLQVAKQVDALDQRLREEQEGNIKTIEMLLTAAGGAGGIQAASGGSQSGSGAPPETLPSAGSR